MGESFDSMSAPQAPRKNPGAKWAIWGGMAAVVLLYWFTIRPHASSIEWSSDLPAAVTKARQTHRPILVAFQIPSCNACEWMSREVFPRKDVGRVLAGWVTVQVDVDANPALAQRFGVSAFPTFLTLSPDGRALRRYEGAMTSEEFITFIGEASVQSATQPTSASSL
jgi:thioredoxin-related protein